MGHSRELCLLLSRLLLMMLLSLLMRMLNQGGAAGTSRCRRATAERPRPERANIKLRIDRSMRG